MKAPVTQAVRVLRAAGVPFVAHLYDYRDGGTAEVAAALGVDEHAVIKTLIMEQEQARPLIVLMHGDREVATGLLARQIGAKRVRACEPTTADKHSGYQVGGTSPFGTRRAIPIYCQQSIAQLERIHINGGRRGFIVDLSTADLLRVLTPTLVDAAH